MALDADTGKLKWHFQFSPHDEFDYDAVQIPVLADAQWQGQPRKLMYFANRNGYFYVLDRATGQFLSGKPFVEVNWASGLDPKSGRPIRIAGKAPSAPPGTLIFPGNQGGTNWYSPSFSPRTGLFYIPTWVNYGSLYVRGQGRVRRRASLCRRGRTTRPCRASEPVRAATAGRSQTKATARCARSIRITGALRWEFKMSDLTWAGIMTTASNVLFSGGGEGYFYRARRAQRKLAVENQLGSVVRSGPMSYAVNGKQHVAIAAGSALFVYKLRE